MSPPASFNLIDQPWILAQSHDGNIRLLSLSDVFAQATEIRQLMGDVPTQVFAINRLMVAIVHRALAPSRKDWLRWWRAGELPQNALDEYLERWRERFDLLHPERPFYQVADLHTSKGEFTGVDRLIADAPANIPYLTTKVGDAVESLDFAEAARWIVHCQAFDVSGIKSGAVGDDRVKGGKGYPIGIAAAGQIGGMLVVGQDQFQTLLLNTVPQSDEQQRADWAAWEVERPCTAASYYPDDKESPHQPDGRAELLTWQSRRLRLVHDGQRVQQALVANGDRFSALNLYQTEPMTAWRQSDAQARRSGASVAFMPRRHVPGRALWRGLSALLESEKGVGLMPETFAWVGGLIGDEELDSGLVFTARALGMEYINNSAVVGAVIDDQVPVPVRLLDQRRADVRMEVRKAIEDTEKAVYAYGDFVANVRQAAGGESGDRGAVREQVYAELDGPFRHWIDRLGASGVSGLDATAAWSETARPRLLRLAATVIENAGPAALVGRIVSGRNRDYHLDAALAERWFRNHLFTIFPRAASLQESR